MTNNTTNHQSNEIESKSNETISLPDMIPTLFPHYIRILNVLIDQLNLMFETTLFESESISMEKSFEDKIRKTYLLLSHLQYITGSLTNSQPFNEHCSHWLLKIYSICSSFTNNDDRKWIKYRYMIIVGTKILDIYLVDMAKSESDSAEHLKLFLSKLDPFTFCIVINHLNQIENVQMSDLLRKTLKNYRKIIDDYFMKQEFRLSIIQQQMLMVFETLTIDKNRMDFETIILTELLNRIVINVVDQDDDETLKLSGLLIEKLCNHYKQID
uniref:Uncharacterized protein LOC113797013 n=1 Tax=Dermatophagoides pteronyssinus TaxID=6956 RepID=A0A6P6YCQ2_DERPT